MKNKKEKNSKVKEFIHAFKEAWKVPSKRAGIKLLGYLVFFMVLFVIAGLSSRIPNENNMKNNISTTTTTTTLDSMSYTYKQKLLLENKHVVSYEINLGEETFKINGNLSNNVLEGYIENNFDIKKIILENDILYEVINNENVIYDGNINIDFINISKIINNIKDKRAYIKEEDGIKTYLYNIDDYEVLVYTNEECIYRIDIKSDIYLYNLNFDVF